MIAKPRKNIKNFYYKLTNRDNKILKNRKRCQHNFGIFKKTYKYVQ